MNAKQKLFFSTAFISIRASIRPTSILPAALLLFCATVGAQQFPDRPIRFLVPGSTGSSQDVLSRVIGNKLAQQLGQQVVVDVRPGASGIIGIELGKAASPDGYTIVVATPTLFATLPALKAKVSYDPDRDFIPLTRMATAASVLTVNTGIGVDSVADLVRLAKAKPGQLNYGSAGNVSPSHIAGVMFDVLADVRTNHVPYKGASQALTDAMGGQLQYLIISPLVAMPHAKGGRIKVLATTGAKRDPLNPELPTVADTIPGYEATAWWGLVLPAKTPPPIVNRLHTEIIKVLQAPEVRELIAKQGATVQPESPAQFVAFLQAERARIEKLSKVANLRFND